MGEKKHYLMGGTKPGEKTKLKDTPETLQAITAQNAEDKRTAQIQQAIDTVSIKCKPLGDRLILKRLLGEEKQGLIIVPNPLREQNEKAKVVAVGPGYPGEPTTVKEGDTVMFTKHGITELEIDGGIFLMCRESDLIAIF